MRLRWYGMAIVVLLAACQTSPLGREQLLIVPEGQVQQMGVAAYREMQQTLPQERDRKINAYVHCVAQAITNQLPGNERGRGWEVTVFRDESANAFALPGGKIGVHTGLLKVATNQDQLAAVIGHEVAHVLARHHAERISQQFATQAGMNLLAVASGAMTPEKQQLFGLLGLGAQFGILLPYSRAQEEEADLYGLDLMARAGFNPRQSVLLWENMQRASGGGRVPELLSTHPAPDTRIQALKARIPQSRKLYEQALAAGRRPNCDG
jgi:predicted Zn-dependent protease